MLVTQPWGRTETGMMEENKEEDGARENSEGPLAILTALPKQPGHFKEVISKEKAWKPCVNRALFT